MAKDKPTKPTRIQFPQGVESPQILQTIKQLRDEWAARNPEIAHKLYPDLYPAPPPDGNPDETKPAE
jgi:hypothetical protein